MGCGPLQTRAQLSSYVLQSLNLEYQPNFMTVTESTPLSPPPPTGLGLDAAGKLKIGTFFDLGFHQKCGTTVSPPAAFSACTTVKDVVDILARDISVQ